MSNAGSVFFGLFLSATFIYCCSESGDAANQEAPITLRSLSEIVSSNTVTCSTPFPQGWVLSDSGVMSARTVEKSPDTAASNQGINLVPVPPATNSTRVSWLKFGPIQGLTFAAVDDEPSHYLPTIYLVDSLLLRWQGATPSDYCILPENSPDSFLSEAVGLRGMRGPLMTKLIQKGRIPLDDQFYAFFQQRFPYVAPLFFREIGSGDDLLRFARRYREIAINQSDAATLTIVQSAFELIASLPGEPEDVRTAARRESAIGTDDRLRELWKSLPKFVVITYFGGMVAQGFRSIALSRTVPLLSTNVVLSNLGAELAGSGAQLVATGVSAGQMPTLGEAFFSFVHAASVALTRHGRGPQQMVVDAQAGGTRPPSSIGTMPVQKFLGGTFPRVQRDTFVYVRGHVTDDWQMVGFDDVPVHVATIAKTIKTAGGIPIIMGCRVAELGLTGPLGLIRHSVTSQLLLQAAGKSHLDLVKLFNEHASEFGNFQIIEQMATRVLVATPSPLAWRSVVTVALPTQSIQSKGRHVRH